MRNGLLAGLASFIVFAGWDSPGASVIVWATGLTRFEALSLSLGAIVSGLLATGGWLLLNLWRQQGRPLFHIEALEVRLGGSGALPAQPVMQTPSGLRVGTQPLLLVLLI
ncbi:MAG: hypothetical protein M3239_05280 [Thermoproteota archaeon]|nr:hypothetical protein [Thermoproteota archaeon]